MEEGIILSHHYTHYWCSPSRRSFLTGRLPLHHGEQLSSSDADDIDLRMSWVSDKLHSVGYRCHMYGKWHTGFRSMRHLPHAHHFASSAGSLMSGGSYSGPASSKRTQRWQDDHPLDSEAQLVDPPAFCAGNCTEAFADELWGALAVSVRAPLCS